jgi:hypothetical protein
MPDTHSLGQVLIYNALEQADLSPRCHDVRCQFCPFLSGPVSKNGPAAFNGQHFTGCSYCRVRDVSRTTVVSLEASILPKPCLHDLTCATGLLPFKNLS